MSTPTIHELIKAATKGPWHLALLEESPTLGPEAAIIPELRFVHRDKMKLLHPDDAQYIARLSPEVMAAVVEALESVDIIYHRPDERGPCLCSQCESRRKVASALSVLNAPQPKE